MQNITEQDDLMIFYSNYYYPCIIIYLCILSNKTYLILLQNDIRLLTYSAQNIGIVILLNLSMFENPLVGCMTRLLWLRALLSTGTPVNYFKYILYLGQSFNINSNKINLLSLDFRYILVRRLSTSHAFLQ